MSPPAVVSSTRAKTNQRKFSLCEGKFDLCSESINDCVLVRIGWLGRCSAVSSSGGRGRRRSIQAAADRNDLTLLILDFYVCNTDPSTDFDRAGNCGETTALCGPQIIDPKIYRRNISTCF